MGGSAVGGRRQTRARRLLLAIEVGGSTAFLAVALLFAQSFVYALQHDPGFETEQVAALELDPSRYGFTAERGRSLIADLCERVRQRPGVRDVSVADHLPFAIGARRDTPVSSDGRDCRVQSCREAERYAVDERFLQAMAIPIVRGRGLTRDDRATGVVVSESMAAALWPDRNPLGQTFHDGPTGQPREVVGVARDVTQHSFTESRHAHFYRLLESGDWAGPLSIVVRTERDPRDGVVALREELHRLAPALPVESAKTMRERLALPLWLPQVMAGFFGVAGAIAVFLATIGVFGMTYYVVMQRTREFGVRMALGATRARLRRLVMLEGLRIVLPGVVAGLLLAAAMGWAARGLLFGISVANPATYLLTAAAQVVVVALACWLPAVRASAVDPLTALRAE
jgi:predicted permease